MAPTSGADRAKMAQAASQIEDAANDIRGMQTGLNGRKGAMMEGWVGNASLAFNKVFTEFDQAFRTTLEQLDKIHEKLVDNRIRYEANEDQTQADIQRLNALLNN
ncbi:WXG100 family type VII secretion target [Actinocorallia populi]|uniref:WXG100 family type VII secretion target n=1 Tax=Actinocorallia populi TaxID=2079200 RepID=UPI0013002B90|nr:WXG100 family type VII secretion target [Actinocorallia populi]